MLESRYDSMAGIISRKALSMAKRSMEQVNASGTKQVSVEDQVDIQLTHAPMTIHLTVQLTLQRSTTDSAIVVASGARDEIDFRIKVVSKTGMMLPLHLSYIQDRLYEASRHELEHLFQDEDPSTAQSAISFFEKPQVMSRRLAYYTHPNEIPAFVSGMYMKAKKLRRPFSDVVEENLEKIRRSMEFRGNTPAQADRLIAKIRRAWMSYAKSRFPNS